MKNNLGWRLRQLYLIYFWPTKFRREFEGGDPDQPNLPRWKPVGHTLKLVTPSVLLVAAGTLITGAVSIALGLPFDREGALASMARGMTLGVVFGSALGMATGAASGVRRGLAGGVAGGIAFGVAGGMAYGLVGGGMLPSGVSLTVTAGVLVGMAFCITFAVSLGITGDAALGAAGGGAVGIAGGVSALVAGGIALYPPDPYDYSPSAFKVLLGWVIGVPFAAGIGLGYFRLVTYPLDIALSAATYVVARWRPRSAVPAWKWSPVAWNELIWLPLPFAGKLLALTVKQDRGEGFRRIAFVAAERRLQRRVVLNALAEVAVDDLLPESLSEMADVTDKLGWTRGVPVSQLPAELAQILPRFERVAQHIGQYLILHSAYHQGEALERAVAETKELQLSLIATSKGLAPRLLQAANKWRLLLETEREKFRRLTEVAREIPNPFVFGNPVIETEYNVFTGRQDLVKQIAASVLGARQTPTLLLQGARRMGKTSILNQLPRLLGPDFAPAVVDCQNPAVTGSEATLLRYLSRALSEGLRRRRVVVEALTSTQLAHEAYAVFDEWLEKVEHAMPGRMRALLCLDEYERLQTALEAGWGMPFLDALRHTFQHRPRVGLMFTGAHTFQELGTTWTDRFINVRCVRVSFLRRKDVELLLTKPIPEFDMTYAAGALDALVAATSGHPFLTQAVAFELVQLLNEGERREAMTADVEEAVGRALVSGDAYFVNVWGDAGAEGQAILRALAAGETPPDSPTARAWLRAHDVIGADGDFAVEMMRRWVVSKAV